GVRIFSDGRNPKDNQPLALQRRMARGLRRQNDRRKFRRSRIVNILVQNGFFPSDIAVREKLKNLDPYVLRTKALDEKLEPYELGRAVFHLGTRRGFQSNRLCNTEEQTATSSGDSKRTKLTQADKINKLTEDIEKSGCRTIGEYLHQRIQNGQVARFKGGDFEGYPSRQHYKTEFQLIRAKQVQFYPDADWQKIFDAIFTQRPLKEQERGQCQFYTDESRAYLCLPSAQQFRIAEEVNNLKYYDLSGITHDLTDEQKDCLINALNECKSKSFNSIRKLLKRDYKFNLENGKRTELKGNDTSCTLRKDEYIGKQWDELPLEIQDEIVDLLMDSQSNEEILENDYFAHLNLNDEQKDKVLSLVFPKKVGRLSSKFMRDCLPFMQHRHLRYDEAVAELGIHHSYNPITEHQDSLPYYGKVLTSLVSKTHPEADESDVEYKYGKIANPTVHIALNQLRRVVNSIIGDYGKPEQIVVELSRDISDSAEKRAETTKKQRENEKENSVAREEIMKISGIANPSGWDIKKYKLWKELGKDDVARRCPYCGKVIPANQLFSKEIEIEHILPYSRTLLDSMGNLTVAHSTCNLAKGNRTPYEAFSGNPAGFDWTEIMGRAQNLPNGKGKLFNKDAMKPFEGGENGFIERQLNDNRYISKAARDYLACICPQNNIWGVPGK
ncbi:MAG: type II CRISPR RNA-guided endonuclease Cas9, partial [Sphaerochaetaceae bacterium]|nr:type II CRISPR RNA-guided endonuclease Cas9 [Sphaerochaetaceae bacterium]